MSPPCPPARDDTPSTRPLLDKLEVKHDSRVAVIGEFPDWFDSHDELVALHDLRQRIEQNGAIWVVSRKGKEATLRDVDVISAALDAGLVDNKVVSFSETHTSLRLVIRVRDRI